MFILLWRALQNRSIFDQYYIEKRHAFDELSRVVTPNIENSKGLDHLQFWTDGKATAITDGDIEVMRSLCRTLRNGLSHFNFRYVNVAPAEYFLNLELTAPGHLSDIHVPGHYRIFIVDWNTKGGKKFMDPESDSRIIETHFAHFRYHLFRFLAYCFSAPDHPPYRDILTLQQL